MAGLDLCVLHVLNAYAFACFCAHPYAVLGYLRTCGLAYLHTCLLANLPTCFLAYLLSSVHACLHRKGRRQ